MGRFHYVSLYLDFMFASRECAVGLLLLSLFQLGLTQHIS